MWSQDYVPPNSQHKWKCPNLTPARQASIQFTYSAGMEGWVGGGVGYISGWFTCPQTVTYLTSNYLDRDWNPQPRNHKSSNQALKMYETESIVFDN